MIKSKPGLYLVYFDQDQKVLAGEMRLKKHPYDYLTKRNGMRHIVRNLWTFFLKGKAVKIGGNLHFVTLGELAKSVDRAVSKKQRRVSFELPPVANKKGYRPIKKVA